MKMKNIIYLIISVVLLSCGCKDDYKYEVSVTPEPFELTNKGGKVEATISTDYSLDKNLGKEEYKIDVTSSNIKVTHGSEVAKNYADATLKQLLFTSNNIEYYPIVNIHDKPRFKYRGYMLDEGRHFQGKEYVKKTLDRMAFHKLNKFHWHLTEDQGWRIEIKAYPKLTEIGAYREGTQVGWQQDHMALPTDSVRYGGFYTQEDIKEVVAYAQKLGIDIIPEIDMPGHMMAALASYPELGVKKNYKVREYWGVAHDVLDVSNPETMKFAKTVINEVCDLFPYKTIHIGGDECPKDQWKKSKTCQALIKKLNLKDEEELQSWFLKEIEKEIQAKGKTMAGWDEILDGDMSPTATVYHWRFWPKENSTIKGAKNGNDIISTLNDRMYFDHYQTSDKEKFEGLAFPAVTPLNKLYNYDPIPAELDKKYHDKVIGVQGNLWTEYVPTNEIADIRTYPRMALLSEVAWSPQEKRDWENMNRKLPSIFKLYDQMGITYKKSYISSGL